MEKYIEVSQEAGKRFYMQFVGKGKFVMLNLLRFREQADYSGTETIAPNGPISGQAAYQRYMELTMPFLKTAGSKLLFYGSSKHFAIGPDSETWDRVLLISHKSVEDFMAFAQNKEYLKIAGHRTAALQDSRLLPISEEETDGFKV